MKTFCVGFILLISVAASYGGLKCGCPVSNEEECPNKRDFIAFRLMNLWDIPSVPSVYPTIGDAIFAVMQVKYSKGIDYFTKALATDGNPAIDPANDIFTEMTWCYHADMTGLNFTLPSGSEYTVDLELRSRALENGVSVEICDCRGCDAELLEYLRENSEYRMTEIVDKMRYPPTSP